MQHTRGRWRARLACLGLAWARLCCRMAPHRGLCLQGKGMLSTPSPGSPKGRLCHSPVKHLHPSSHTPPRPTMPGHGPRLQVPRCPQSGRIAAYLALHGHGTYPTPGRVLRHFFLGNDLCSADGPVWRPRQVVLLPQLDNPAAAAPNCGSLRCRLAKVPTRGCLLPRVTASSPTDEADAGTGSSGLPEVLIDGDCTWVLFRGCWGKADAPCEQSWMKGAEPPVSRTPFQRLFCHFLPETESVEID